MKKAILLIVDDEKSTRQGLKLALEERFDCYLAADEEQARAVLQDETIDLLLTDLRLGGSSGMDVLDFSRKLPKPPVVVVMTAYGSVDTAVEAIHRGAWHFVTKPLNLEEIELLLLRALRSKSLETENQRLTSENKTLKSQISHSAHGLDRLIGKSSAMKKIGERITQVAPTKATVLILGESGTGKELVARAIHDLSGRPTDKLVTLNCAALSPQLLESELFGHEKGSFTGAGRRRIGRFEQAHQGTLFLDEIGEIDGTTQVKLLRALSERTIERVGSNTPINVDVRLVSATNQNLEELVAKGDFREDLFFRLNVVRVEMPPLRERPDDIVLLVNVFLQEFAKENNRSFKPLSEEAFQLLLSHSWPGNVRELRTAIEHGVVMSNEAQILPKHLPRLSAVRFSEGVQDSSPKNVNKDQKNLESESELNLHVLEIATIRRALERSRQNRTKAADLLGISRRTLQRKLIEIENLYENN